MRRTLILSLAIAAIISAVMIFTAKDASTSTACPNNCGSTVILNTNFANCSGVRCGGPDGTVSFTTDANGDFSLGCRCAGTYWFCLGCGGGTWSVTVDGSGNVFYAVQGGSCPCPDR